MYYNYTLRPKNAKSDPKFEIISVNQLTYDVNWHSMMHYHDFTEIIYCLDGEGHIQTNFGMQPLFKDSLIIVNPYIEHTEHSSIHNPLKYIVIGFRGPEIIFPNHMTENDLIIFYDNNHIYYNLLQLMINEIDQDRQYTSNIINHLAHALLLSLSDEARVKLDAVRPKPLTASVSLAKNYIDNNYSKVITLETLEERSHISRFHLSHLFKTELGLSPINYLQEVRFKHAIKLLETTNHSVIQISSMVGFKSNNYFSRKFKEKYEISPKQYRNNKRHSHS